MKPVSNKKNLMQIGAAAKQAGISRQSLQYYLMLGLMEATETAHHFPYVSQWNEISAVIDEAVASALLGTKTVQGALDDAAADVNALLAQ